MRKFNITLDDGTSHIVTVEEVTDLPEKVSETVSEEVSDNVTETEDNTESEDTEVSEDTKSDDSTDVDEKEAPKEDVDETGEK